MKKKQNKHFLIIFLLIILITPLWSGVMAKPRRVSLLKTTHFDILFSEPSIDNAIYLAENIDSLYDKAKDYFPDIKDIRIPVIITPDSDRLHVQYTSSPYNRIVFFEGVSEKEDNVFEDTVLGLFYHEIYLALSQSVRSPFNQFIHDTIGGDRYQPISLVYLPFSFVEGRTFLADGQSLIGQDEEDNSKEYELGYFNDPAFLEILSIAKYYDKFPNVLQASTARDIYPGRILNDAAGSAFTAYLISTYGIEKYNEFWTKCGDVNFLLTRGLFNSVYDKPISEVWDDFEDSIPLPSNILKDSKETKIFPYETESLFNNILVTDYGLVWYDGIRHEVDIFDWNNPLKIKQLLFLASDVKKLSLSPDGRYMVVSFYGIKTKDEFRNDKAWIYDLQKRRKLDFTFLLREGEIIRLPNGDYGVAGINVKSKVPKLQVYSLNYKEETSSLYYEKTFPLYEYPFSVTYGGRGIVNYLVSKNNVTSFRQLDLSTKEERTWTFNYRGQTVNLDNIKAIPPSKQTVTGSNEHFYYVAEYFANDEPSFSRMALVKLSKNYEPEEIYFQNIDVDGGVNYPYISNNNLYYVANRFDHSDLMMIPLSSLSFEEGEVIKQNKDLTQIKNSSSKKIKEKMGNELLSELNNGEEIAYYKLHSEEKLEEVIAETVKQEIVIDENINNITYKKEEDITEEKEETLLNENKKDNEYEKERVEEKVEDKKEDKEKLNEKNIVTNDENIAGIKIELPELKMPQAHFLNKNTIQSGNNFYSVEKYNPFKYLIHCSFRPFLAIKDLATTEEQKLFPSLGATIITQDDPFMNNKIMISGSGGYAPLDFQQIVNPSLDDINEKKLRHVDDDKNLSAAISIENSSSPIDIKSGVLFKANTDGEYMFQANLNTSWPISLGMAFSNINLTMNAYYKASTDYYDMALQDKFKSLNGFPKFSDAYETGKLTLGFEYNNIHQCGISPYEMRGFKIGATFDSFWDIYELHLLKKNVDKIEEEQNKELTPAQIKKLYTENRFDLSTLNIGFYTDIKIPRLTPFNMYNNFIFSLPTDFYFELLRENGTALHLRTETLLFGYEAQDGIPPLYLFFSRIGLKAGYDFQLRYDTHKVPLPDIRKNNNLYNVFSNSYIRDSVFLIFDMNFCSGIGRMSEYHVNMSMKAEYFLRSQSFAFRVKFTISL